MNHIIGTGFNFAFFDDSSENCKLEIPNDVTFMEGGVFELKGLKPFEIPDN